MRCASPLCVASLAAILSLPSCAAVDPAEEIPEAEEYELVAPTLDSIAPSQISLGDTVKVFGANFVPPEHGSMSLFLQGKYTDSDGQAHEFDGEIILKVLNDSVAEFEFEQIFFHPNQDKIGTWQGSALLVNRMPDREDLTKDIEKWSEEQNVSLRVMPSIMVERLRSADERGCALVTRATNAQHNIELGFRAVGFGEASEANPWDVRVSFISPDVTAYYVTPDLLEDGLPFWPLRDLEGNQTTATQAQPGNQRIRFEITNGSTVVLDPTRTARLVDVNPPVTIGDKMFDEVLLGKLASGSVEFAGKTQMTFLVEIVARDGRELRRLVVMDVWNEFEIGIWNGQERLSERYEPHSTSGCIPGGLIGGELAYSEGESLSKARSVGVRWDANVGRQLGFSAGNINIIQLNGSQSWSESFGVDITDSVSSETHRSQNISIHLLPSFYGMSYRQLERLERKVDVVYHNACGASGVVGEAVLTNWNFGFEVSQDKTCPPASNLPDPVRVD